MNFFGSCFSRFVLPGAVFLFCLTTSFAQTNTAEIVGTVQDTSGAVLPGATVIANHQASGLTVERVTGDQGEFLLPALPVGEHTLIGELPGFKHLVRQGIVLRVGQRASLDLVLELGEITESITVTCTVFIIQKSNAKINDIIENERVVDLPLNGRTFLQLALLSEGVVKPPGGKARPLLQDPASQCQCDGHQQHANQALDKFHGDLVEHPLPDHDSCKGRRHAGCNQRPLTRSQAGFGLHT